MKILRPELLLALIIQAAIVRNFLIILTDIKPPTQNGRKLHAEAHVGLHLRGLSLGELAGENSAEGEQKEGKRY